MLLFLKAKLIIFAWGLIFLIHTQVIEFLKMIYNGDISSNSSKNTKDFFYEKNVDLFGIHTVRGIYYWFWEINNYIPLVVGSELESILKSYYCIPNLGEKCGLWISLKSVDHWKGSLWK